MRNQFVGFVLRETEMAHDFICDGIALPIGQRAAAGAGDFHHHDGGGFAGVVNQVEAVAARPVLEGKAPGQVGGRPRKVDCFARAVAGHAQPPRPDADGHQDAENTDQELHGKSVARPNGTRATYWTLGRY